MFVELDPLLDFRCPHCSLSLRFRRLRRLPTGHQVGLDDPRRCPGCEGLVHEHRHPALRNPWLWSRFTLPGVLLCALCLFVPALNGCLPYAVLAMAAGLLALIGYMIRARWGWQQYRVWTDPSS